MSKERTSITVDPEVKAYLQAEGRNASETVNRLVKLDMGEDVMNEQILRFRMENAKDNYHDAANEAKKYLKRYNKLKKQVEQIEEEREESIEECVDRAVQALTPSQWMESVSREKQIPGSESDELKAVASDLGVDPETLYNRVLDRVMED